MISLPYSLGLTAMTSIIPVVATGAGVAKSDPGTPLPTQYMLSTLKHDGLIGNGLSVIPVLTAILCRPWQPTV
jgi:hypothetical protein